MYDIRQFRPALYLLTIVGITGFAAAAASPGLWLAATMLWGLNAVLAASGRLRPMPRIVANLATLLAGVWAASRLFAVDAAPILSVGQFLVMLHLIKLYEQRANRDAGQLIVLSLLLMVAAAITTPELWFGLLLVGYLFLSLYCCLLFHLKVETDAAKRVMGLRDDRPGDLRRLRQDQRRLGSSMRRLTAAVSVAAIGSAVVVFLAFPRGSGASFVGGPRFATGQAAVTGFNGSVGFQDIARITQNTTPVAYLALERDGRPVAGTETLYLRGNTLDIYVSDPDAPDRWTWKSSQAQAGESPARYGRRGRGDGGDLEALERIAATSPQARLRQSVELEPVGIGVLPALAGVTQFHPESSAESRRVSYSPADGTLSLPDGPARGKLEYVVWSTGQVPPPLTDADESAGRGPAGLEAARDLALLRPVRDRAEMMRRASLRLIDDRDARRTDRGPLASASRFGLLVPDGDLDAAASAMASGATDGRGRGGDELLDDVIDAAQSSALAASAYPAAADIVRFVLDPEVGGRDAQGRSLAELRLRRGPAAVADDPSLDERITRSVERYLQREYRYSLDVTDARRSADQDPMAWFVGEDGRRGHCEYFAGTLALAVQSVGIPARVVVGFKCDEYNPSLGKYVVRQSHAHAWVEVLTNRGWISFDPTSGNGDDLPNTSDGLLRRARQWVEYLQYSWANHVVAYDNGTRQNLLQNLENGVLRDGVAEGAGGVRGLWQRFEAWLDAQNFYLVSARVIAWLTVAAAATMLLAVAYFVFEKVRLRRLARRIGLVNLPSGQARRLARQLGFYDEMLQLLGRHGHHRAASQTPREFARSLSHLPREAFEATVGLTEVFYRIRYGGGRVTPQRRRWLGRGLDTLAGALSRS